MNRRAGSVAVPAWPSTDATSGPHVGLVYEEDDDLFQFAGAYLAEALRAEETAVAVVAEGNRSALLGAVSAAGADVARRRADGRLIMVDAVELLAAVSVGGRPDAAKFDAKLGGLFRAASSAGSPVHGYCELSGLLWDEGRFTAAIELEEMWNTLRRQLRLSLFCPLGCTARTDDTGAFERVSQLHSVIVDVPTSVTEADRPWAIRNEINRTYPMTTASPRAARHFVMAVMDEWGWSQRASDAALVVTELATNAVLHAQSEFTVSVLEHPSALRVSVSDHSAVPPVRRNSSLLAGSGRGLDLLDGLTHDWGIEIFVDRKLVWAEFCR